MADNTIQIIIEGIDRASPEFQKAMTSLQNLSTVQTRAADVTTRSTVATERYARSAVNVQSALSPLTRSVSQVTNQLAALNPQFQVAIGAVDNMAFRAIAAARGAQTFGQALTASLGAILNPYTLGVLALVTGLGFLIGKWREAAQEAKDFELAQVSGDTGPFQKKLLEKTLELRKLEEKLRAFPQQNVERGEGPPSLGDTIQQRAFDVKTNNMRKEEADITAAIAKLRQEIADIQVKELGLLAQSLGIQAEMVGASDRQKIDLEYTARLTELRGKFEAGINLDTAEEGARLLKNAQILELSRQFQIETLKIDAGILGTSGNIVAEHEKLVEAILKENAGLRTVNQLRSETLRFVEALKQEEAEVKAENAKGLAQSIATLAVSARTKELELQIQMVPLQKEIQTLQQRIATEALKTGTSYDQILAKVGELDQLQRDAIDLQIQANDIKIFELEQEKNIGAEQRAQIDNLAKQNQLLGVQRGLIDGQKELLANITKQGEAAAGNMARTFLDNFINIVQAVGTEGGVGAAFRNLGATIGKEFLEAFIKEMLIRGFGVKELAAMANQTIGSMLFGSLKSLMSSGQVQSPIGGAFNVEEQLWGQAGGAAKAVESKITEETLTAAGTGLLTAAATVEAGGAELSIVSATVGGAAVDLIAAAAALQLAAAAMTAGGFDFGALIPGLDMLGMGGMAHGGYVIPNGAVRAFSGGGMVRNGPMMGVIGEEGPEIIARMKPAGTSKNGDGDIHQKIFLVDQRPKGLGPNDVVLTITGAMERGGPLGKAVMNVIKRKGG